MDNSDIYEYRFEELIGIMRRDKEMSAPDGTQHFEGFRDDYVIDIAGNAFRDYQSLVKTNESWAVYTLERILMNLLEKMGIQYDIPRYEETTRSGRRRPIRPFAFSIIVDGNRLGYIFRYRVTKGLPEIRETLDRFDGIDGVRFYLLNSNPSVEGDQIDLLNRLETEDDASRIVFATLKDFFEEFMPQGEYESFVRHADKFNERARRLIGFQSQPMPTKEAIEAFKSQLSEHLGSREESFRAMLPSDMYPNQRDTLVEGYFGHRLYTAMVGKTSFADSFVSSEWNYATRTPTGELDQTGVVTGYLKSVEQLLDAVLHAALDSGTVTQEHDDYEAALGDLIRRVKSVRFDRNVCRVNGFVMKHLIDKLYEFKDTERNGHLHGTNIYDEDTIESIRSQAMYLHFLILGAFRIEERSYADLGVLDDETQSLADMSTDLFYGKFKRWISPMILFDTPHDAGAIALMLMKFTDRPWELTYQVLQEVREEDYGDVSWNHRMISSSSMTNNSLRWEAEWTWDEGVAAIKEAFSRFVAVSNPAADSLKAYPKIVLGSFKVIEVLYER
ncbi:hypothetical protein [Collinsella bouchesdurhonensis]|uniref:hypothetical protein n=1 Tax=Collinsella bouchesdurhonensis TaxID=1907654 RepID=UPI00058C9291|nr:hypothetical protein [Collinsella bouchesdurhonensis]